jgi:germination protein M
MARRKKKNNTLKFLSNLIVFIFLLFVIFFLVQKFIIPLWQNAEITPRIPEEAEEEDMPEVLGEDEVTLYFSDGDAQYLVPELRKISQTGNSVKQAVVELIKGPHNDSLYPTVPQTTKVNAIYVSDKIAYIDLSPEVVRDHPGGSTGELLTVYSIVMTLTSFPEIDKVQILIDGNSGETLVGHVDTSVPLERDENWLRK